MAASTTYINQATLATGATLVTVSGYTAPAGRAKPIAQVGDERLLIVDASLSPTLQVVRGYQGTTATGHVKYEAFKYGAPVDMPDSKGSTQPYPTEILPTIYSQTQEITSTGTGATDAALVNVPWPAYLHVGVGASGAGINLPVPVVGEAYTIKNDSTGALLIYSSGATINTQSGATGYTVTTTGNKMAWAFCSTAGTWQIGGNT